MGKFNLDEYEPVKKRKLRFYNDNPEGRIIVKNVTPKDQHLEYAMFEVSIYLNREDHIVNRPVSVGYAMEIRDKELKQSSYGKKYESVNYSSWTENCEESAIGRALDNAGYGSGTGPSREEMKKAEVMDKVVKEELATKDADYRNALVEEYSAGMIRLGSKDVAEFFGKDVKKEARAHFDKQYGSPDAKEMSNGQLEKAVELITVKLTKFDEEHVRPEDVDDFIKETKV